MVHEMQAELYKQNLKNVSSPPVAAKTTYCPLSTPTQKTIIMVILASHVDDILWAADPAAEHVIDSIKSEMDFGTLDEGSFCFWGVEMVHDEDVVFRVTCTQTTKKWFPIPI